MKQLFWFSVFLFIISLTNAAKAQLVWQDDFKVVDKGVWGTPDGTVVSDFDGVDWSLDTDSCEFSDENDYAKTVSTAGGRFEVLDADGTVYWKSPVLNITNLDAVKIAIQTGETGSSENESKKFIKAAYRLNENEPVYFDEVAGNWGEKLMYVDGVFGESLQIVLQLNSSYTNDKVFVSDVLVEFVDSSKLIPTAFKTISLPYFGITEDTLLIQTQLLNANNEVITDTTLVPLLLAPDFQITNAYYNDGYYFWKIVTEAVGELSYSIQIDFPDVEPVDSSIIVFERAGIVVKEDFEGASFQGWDFNDDWSVSDQNSINGNYSLQHIGQANATSSEVIYSGATLQLTEQEYFFSFLLKNGDWNPSASNSFFMKLSDGNKGNENGYLFGVNADNTSDLVTVWKMENGVPGEMLAETNISWDVNTIGQFAIFRKPEGDWTFVVLDKTNQESAEVKFSNNEVVEIREMALTFNYTSSRAGELWMDDFTVIGQNSGPFITQIKMVSANSFTVHLNEAIDWIGLTSSNFMLTTVNGDVINLKSIEQESEQRVLLTSETLVEAAYVLTAYDLTDEQGMTTDETSIRFENALPATEYDIVFTEIMADPNPPNGLPDAEFLEFQNRSNKFIQLEGFELFVRNSSWYFPRYLIAPGEILIVVEAENVELFTTYGNVLAFDDFPSLLNDGALLELKNTEGMLIERIKYTEDWYGDKFKANGGYSLERIDTERLCGQRGNWLASIASDGGTPGASSSLTANNTDNERPIALAVNVLSYSVLEVVFNEAIDTIEAASISNYRISGLPITNVLYNQGELVVTILVESDLELNEDYFVEIKGITDECGNQIQSTLLDFSLLSYGQGTVMLSEVLFNPYPDASDFVEVKNTSGKRIDLAGLVLATRDERLELKSICRVSELHRFVEPDEYIVFTDDSASILQNYEVMNPENIVVMEQMPAFNNDEGRVVVLSDSLLVIDEFAYNEEMHSDWITSFDGVSLERISFEEATNLEGNWTSASSLAGFATPTYENSQQPLDEDQVLDVTLESDVVSPNGDGYNDELVITFKLDKTGYLVNMYAFDAAGREVRRLTNYDLIGNMNELRYDVTDQNGKLLDMGIYLFYCELINIDGSKKVFKISFLVTDRL